MRERGSERAASSPWVSWSAAVLFGVCGCAGASRPIAELSEEDWEADLSVVVEVLTERHPDPFGYHRVAEDEFHAQIESVREAIRAGVAGRTVLELDRLVAMVGDGHTSLDAVQARAGLRRLPVGAQFFGDELWIHAVAPGHERALGGRVVALNAIPTATALDSVSRLIAHDNPQEFRYAGATWLLTPEALAFVGAGGGSDTVSITLSRGDSTIVVEVSAWPLDRLATVEWVRARDREIPPPLRQSRPSQSYWFEHVPDADAMYVYWDRVDDADGGPSLNRFYDDLFDAVDRHDVERLIVDLRQNNGGNYHKADRFVEEIQARERIARTGGLYVLTGPRTFSAATHLAARLRFEANGLVAGEVSRGNPNRTYNSETVVLRRSGLSMEYTERLEDPQPFPQLGDMRYVPVDVPVHDTFQDYLAGRDAVLEAALRHRR